MNKKNAFFMGSILLLFLSLLLAACQSPKENTPVRISMESSAIVSDSIETMMPGELFVSEKYILWTDPFHSDKFIHVLDKNTGKELTTLLQKGEGPAEFLSPGVSLISNEELFVFDFNSAKTAILSIDKTVNGESPFVLLENQEMKNTTRVIGAEKEEFIQFSPSDKHPFLFRKDKNETPFGNLPVQAEVENSYDVFQGGVAYSSSRQMLVYSTFEMPYIAIYKRNKNSFSLYKDVMKNKDYDIKDNSFIYNGKDRGAIQLTLLADYIVTLERDRTIDDTDEKTIGRDFSKLPQTIFLYDYDLNLKKIINLGMPILRLASESSTNTLYAIGVNPDFVLLRYEL